MENKKPEFYIVRFEGYSDLDYPDYEWLLATSEADAIEKVKEAYNDYDLGDFEVYPVSTASNNRWYYDDKPYRVEVVAIEEE